MFPPRYRNIGEGDEILVDIAASAGEIGGSPQRMWSWGNHGIFIMASSFDDSVKKSHHDLVQ